MMARTRSHRNTEMALNRGKWRRPAAALALAALMAGPALGAVTSDWKTAADGSFDVGGNWVNGIPGATDTARFNLTGAYKVTFPTASDTSNTTLLVKKGTVTFELSAHTYFLTAASSTNSVSVGDASGDNATLSLTNGMLSGVRSMVGNVAGSTGAVSISGAGNKWISSERLYVANAGNGSLSISNGAYVESGGQTYIGSAAGTTGEIGITGSNSQLAVKASSDGIWIGRGGAATLNISNGGLVTSNYGYIGYNGGTGTVNVSSGGTWTNANDLTFGRIDAGNGTPVGKMYISSGGKVSNGVAVLGRTANGTGEVTVQDDGSTWTSSGAMTVGNAGVGTVTIQNGGTASSKGASIGQSGIGSGTVLLTGRDATTHVASKWTSTDHIYVGGSSTGAGGSGSLSVGNGGVLSMLGKTLKVYNTGTLNLDGESSIAAGSVSVIGGKINVTLPTNTITGNVTLDADTTTTFHLVGDSVYGGLDVTGTLALGNSALKVVLDGNYAPSNGDSYDLLDWGTLSSTFDPAKIDLSLAPLASGLSWDTSSLNSTGVISVVPEPAVLGMLGIGAMGLLLKRRRRA